MPAQQGAGPDSGPSGAAGQPPGERLASDPGSGRLEAVQVRAMFDRIAGVYDLDEYRDDRGPAPSLAARAAELARVGPGDRVLEVATGTGDLALELARRVSPGREVIGSDFAEAMLARARRKAASGGGSACGPALSGATRSSSHTLMPHSPRRPSGSARATSQISPAASPR